MRFAYVFAAGMFLAAVSCERHDWEDTKVLHESHGDHGHAEGGDHGEDDHAEEDGGGH